MEWHCERMLIGDYCPDFFIEKLKSLGLDYVYRPEVTNEELYDEKDEYTIILIKSSLQLSRDFFKHFNKIKRVLRPGSGLDNIDLTYCSKHHIEVINSPEGNSEAVGEMVVGLLLSLVRSIPKANFEVGQNQWIREANRGIELKHRGLGIIGVGNTGTAFAKKIRGFEPKYLLHDINKSRSEEMDLEICPLKQVFANAEIVSLHLPLDSITAHYADAEFFEAFEKPIYFINASRGGVVCIKSLYNSIKSGQVIRAALDVLPAEPIEKLNSTDRDMIAELMSENKIIATPHIAGWTYEAKDKMFQLLLDRM